MNPVRAGMVDAPGQYKWSSYCSNALGKNNSCLTEHEVYKCLGSNEALRQHAYKVLFTNHLEIETLDMIRNSTQQNTIIGNFRFQDEIKHMLKRRVGKYTHGGDRKSSEFDSISNVLPP